MIDNNIFLFGLAVIVVIILVGGYYGYGTTIGMDVVSPEAPVEGNPLTFAWNGAQFLFALLLFSVPGIPLALNLVIDLICAYPLLFVGLKFVRGTGG